MVDFFYGFQTPKCHQKLLFPLPKDVVIDKLNEKRHLSTMMEKLAKEISQFLENLWTNERIWMIKLIFWVKPKNPRPLFLNNLQQLKPLKQLLPNRPSYLLNRLQLLLYPSLLGTQLPMGYFCLELMDTLLLVLHHWQVYFSDFFFFYLFLYYSAEVIFLTSLLIILALQIFLKETADLDVTTTQIKSKINTTGFSDKITAKGNPLKQFLTPITPSARMSFFWTSTSLLSFHLHPFVLHPFILSFFHSNFSTNFLALTIEKLVNNWENYSVFHVDNNRILIIWASILHRNVEINFIPGTRQIELTIRVDPMQYVDLFIFIYYCSFIDYLSLLLFIYFSFAYFLVLMSSRVWLLRIVGVRHDWLNQKQPLEKKMILKSVYLFLFISLFLFLSFIIISLFISLTITAYFFFINFSLTL